MARGKATSPEMCWTVVQLSGIHSPTEIKALTGVSTRNQRRILKRFKDSGDPSLHAVLRRGRPRHLRTEEVAVRCHVPLYDPTQY